MSEQYVLLEHCSGINVIIQNIFKTTQRIKLTAFDVSSKYIIFGVNSGGIYIFNREPCQFLKLIPSTHGPTNLLVISPDEQNLAIAFTTGVIIILEDCFETNFQQQVFTDHENTTVTALKWNGNDLYCGDSNGRVSVINFKNFLTKTMFQAPIANLLNLDSQIIQLDTYSKFLLVSTKTRSVLCDTNSEKYRQIGKKPRDGNFGACFFNIENPPNVAEPQSRISGIFQTIADDERLSTNPVNGNVKIYCARPGARLWRSDFDGNVVVTHQFRSSLTQFPSKIIEWNDGDALKVKSFEFRELESFSFNKIFPFVRKFIVTFTGAGIYVFEPSSCALLHWTSSIANIKDVKIVDSFLYIWHDDLEVSVLSLTIVEDLVLKSLMQKRYRLCAEICVEYLDHVIDLIATSKRIHLVSCLEKKIEETELLDCLKPVFQRLKESAKIPKLEKFKNGIVTVNLPEPVENFTTKKDDFQSILLEQYKVNKIHANIETNDFARLMKTLDSNTLHRLFAKFNESVNEENTDLWCKEVFLKHLTVDDINPEVLKYGCDAFLRINSSADLKCRCDFPLPGAHKSVPKFAEIGRRLMDESKDWDNFVKNVPYLHKFVLQNLNEIVEQKVALIVQFSDAEVMEILSNKITYDMWDESIRFLLKLKAGQCVNCGAEINNENAFEWTDFGTMMVQSIKPTNAIKLLKRYTKYLPKGELDEFFYQYCIFSAAANVTSCDLTKILKENTARKEFETSVGGYLRKKYLRDDDYFDSSIRKPADFLSNCDQCQLPLNTQIIDQITKLNCGHNYHRVCFVHNSRRCPLCESSFIK